MKCVLVHYGEIGIKGGNRRYFEKKLVENIKRTLRCRVERQRGRIILRNFKEKEIEKLNRIAGISSFALADEVALDMKKISKAVAAVAKSWYRQSPSKTTMGPAFRKGKKKTFRITARRSNKSFRLNSMELNRLLGGVVIKATKMKVDLHNPDVEIFVEITEKAYIYAKKIPGIEGLPVGSAGKVVSLLSGGIDSPVAAYRMMTRGCRVVFVHFHNYDPFGGKIEKLVKTLSSYQHFSTLYMIPFKEVQQEIIKKTMKGPKDQRYRMLLYRRLMMQIAEQVAKKEGALGLVTGDSVAQVASQTLQNLNVIYEPVKLPVFSPLIGSSKNEIINQARGIGTYETSIQPYTDCCSVLVGRHPSTHASVAVVKKLERKLRVSFLARKALKKAEVVRIQ